MDGRRKSVAVILNVGGSPLDPGALRELPQCRVVRADFARGERAACVAATLEHDCDSTALLRTLKPWAARRGWSVTVAPLDPTR